MQIISIYLLIGLVFSITASEIDKMPSEDGNQDIMTHTDKVIYILLWPVIIFYLIYKLKK
ncbi:hypothetical protein [Maribacter luteus]|uniref:hypothetical protein n=1 Tax=Maribacter luteus TaxID=2594478 RepID=UPI0024910A7B|nr:hypothetical protein [Maribacter luteus]